MRTLLPKPRDVTSRPIQASIPSLIQRKLAINAPGDTYEQEADRVAGQVMRMPGRSLQRACACGGSCADCKKNAAPASVYDVLGTAGQPLDAATRAFMEPRFGFDFASVRVHAGTTAAQSADEVGARAYTVGHHLVFGAGAFAPATAEGRQLIAHELVHVVQQTGSGAGPALQRQPKPDAPKDAPQPASASADVVVFFNDDPGPRTTASVLAPGARTLRATSVDDLAKQLKSIKGPVRTLYFVAHMTDDGNLVFDAPSTKTFEPAERIADKVKGSIQVDNLNFQGCSIAQSPGEMQRIAVALKATRATGSTCTLVEQTAAPVMVNNKPILRPEQLADKTIKAAFDAGFRQAHDLFVDKKKKCILNDSVEGYFKAGGRLTAYWANPESMADDAGWDDSKSVCYKDLKTETLDPTKKLPVLNPDDCKLIEVARRKP